VEAWNWLLWWKKELHREPHRYREYTLLAPLYQSASGYYLLGKKDYDVVDRFHFNGVLNGQTMLIRNFAWHFALKGQRQKIRERILKTVIEAQKEADVIGLGALTKAEWLTQGGQWIVDELGDSLRVPVVHGDTLTAAVVCRQLESIMRARKVDGPIFITGATSKIGRAVVLWLAGRGMDVQMFTESEKRFEEMKSEAGPDGARIRRAKTLEEGSRCSVWITGKASPGGERLLKALPKEAVVVNFSVPNPTAETAFMRRPDVSAMEGGLLAYDPARTDLAFTMRLVPGLTYACHAGTMVHAYNGWKHHEVGAVDLSMLTEVWQAAQELGFYLPAEKTKG
jgi:predicted amino acid dehydrogenase